MKTNRTKACVVEALFRTSFCTKMSTRFCTECGFCPKCMYLYVCIYMYVYMYVCIYMFV